MNKFSFSGYKFAGAAAGAALIASAMALPASAVTVNLGAGANASASAHATATANGLQTPRIVTNDDGTKVQLQLGASVEVIVNHADKEITRRITALEALETRVENMARLSADEQGSLSSTIQSQITALNDLKTKIDADVTANNTTTLKTDVHSITESYRIFMLVLPQGAIEAAADRVLTISGIMADLSTKLSSRISAAASAGNDVSAAQTALTDMNAKISDANTQIQAANTEAASLTLDNGSSTVMKANTSALQDARAKVVAAQHDLIAARADAMTIIRALGGFKASVNASTTVSSTASTSAQ